MFGFIKRWKEMERRRDKAIDDLRQQHLHLLDHLEAARVLKPRVMTSGPGHIDLASMHSRVSELEAALLKQGIIKSNVSWAVAVTRRLFDTGEEPSLESGSRIDRMDERIAALATHCGVTVVFEEQERGRVVVRKIKTRKNGGKKK